MTTVEEPRCHARDCKHFRLGDGIRFACPAFPEGIPDRIAYGDDPHSGVAPDQVGSVVYEPRTDRERDMEALIARLDSPDRLEQFASNVESHSPSQAQAARRRAVELRAAAYGATSEVERECLEAIYAYERAESKIRGRKFRASRTWPMIERRGIIPAVEFVVTRPDETTGYRTLVEMGLQDMAFEAVVIRHPDAFSSQAVEASKRRLRQWEISR